MTIRVRDALSTRARGVLRIACNQHWTVAVPPPRIDPDGLTVRGLRRRLLMMLRLGGRDVAHVRWYLSAVPGAGFVTIHEILSWAGFDPGGQAPPHKCRCSVCGRSIRS